MVSYGNNIPPNPVLIMQALRHKRGPGICGLPHPRNNLHAAPSCGNLPHASSMLSLTQGNSSMASTGAMPLQPRRSAFRNPGKAVTGVQWLQSPPWLTRRCQCLLSGAKSHGDRASGSRPCHVSRMPFGHLPKTIRA